jgi:hypothetical protein
MEEGYHDRDRVATEQSLKAYSDHIPRAALRVSTTVGLVVSIASVAPMTRSPKEDIFFGQALALMIDPALWVRFPSPRITKCVELTSTPDYYPPALLLPPLWSLTAGI